MNTQLKASLTIEIINPAIIIDKKKIATAP